MNQLTFLGPQAPQRSASTCLQPLDFDGPAAVVAAGWQEEETADEALLEILPQGSVNLKLFERSESLFEQDAELISLLKQRQDQLRHVRDVYRSQLDRQLEGTREQIAVLAAGHFDYLPEVEFAFTQLRELDDHYLQRTNQICDDFDRQLDFANRPAVAAQRSEIQELMSGCHSLVITGGHVAIILNRLKIFGVLEHNDLPIVAWSAGAMALANRIVLFHDKPPQGKGNPELLRAGMGLYDDLVLLPDADRRLDLANRDRVSLFARRFAPAKCLVLDSESIVTRDGGNWRFDQCRELVTDGSVQEATS